MVHSRSEEASRRRQVKSEEAMCRRQVRRLIFSNSFQDKTVSETVSLCTRLEILHAVVVPPGVSMNVNNVPDIMKGEVLVDSRGLGSFQTMMTGRG